MPTAALHSHFWSDTVAGGGADPPIGASASGGYVPWQITTIRAGGFFCGAMLLVRWAPPR